VQGRLEGSFAGEFSGHSGERSIKGYLMKVGQFQSGPRKLERVRFTHMGDAWMTLDVACFVR
jgi:hypothetical protein